MDLHGLDTFFQGTADITKSKVSIPDIGFNKEAGINTKINFSGKQGEDDIIHIESFKAEGDNISASGNMTIEKSQLTSLSMEKVKYSRNDLKVNYAMDHAGYKIDLKGNSLDLSNVSFGQLFQNDKSNEKKSLDLKIDAEKLYMKNGEVLDNFSAKAICNNKLCTSANANGKFKDSSSVSLSLKPLKKNFALLVKSDNAGALINALGISKNIRGGALNVDATFVNANNKLTAQGTIVMHDFVAIKTPLLGKILTLASLQGIGDILNNQGITFKKFEAPFTLAGGIITVTDAKSSGSSVGITSSGTINLTKSEVDLKGAIVPAYEINKAFGKIPLIGNLLVGKKNEGLIATNYRIKGPYDDVKASVNPLSILTPGVLRNIFDIGD
jgi:hypothetical protein